MPLAEIAVEVAGGLLRLVGQFFIEIVLELLIKGPGYLICRRFNSEVNPDGAPVILTGMAVWAVLIGVGCAGYLASSRSS